MTDIQEKIRKARDEGTKTGNYSAYYDACNERLKEYTGDIEYLTARGISKETAAACYIGIDDTDEAEDLARLIIPLNPITATRTDGATPYICKGIYLTTGATAYINTIEQGRDTGNHGDYYEQLGAIFHAAAFRNDNTRVYVCTDILDALSVEEAGGAAAAMLNYDAFDDIDRAAAKYKGQIIITANKTEQGAEGGAMLKNWLNSKGREALPLDICGEYETVNEHLKNNRNAFMQAFREAVPPKELYRSKDAAHTVDELQAYVKRTGAEKAISTGFIELDDLIGDGIRTGLYFIGAISSLGKTTFILQIADYIAKQGQDVLFFSLEQSAVELVAKSISRETYDEALRTAQSTKQARTATDILNGRLYAKYTEQEKKIIERATANYRAYGEHIHIIEGIGDVDIKRVQEAIAHHEAITGNKPVIFIDYLQIMAPPTDPNEPRRSYTDKQAIDKNVLELKRLSRNYAIIAISSFNRASYYDPVDLASFKESGGIEYTSDVLIGLQYKGMDRQAKTRTKDGEEIKVLETESEHNARITELIKTQKDRKKRGEPLNIQLKILKDRLRATGDIDLLFYPAFNLYLSNEHPKGATTPDKDGFIQDITSDSSAFIKPGVIII